MASVLGTNRVGFYGGSGAITRVLDAGKAAKAWQTSAFRGIRNQRISLYQYEGSVSIANGSCDIDEGYDDDLGQWSTAATPIPALPSLSYTRQGNNLVLSWPTNDSAFMLYYTTNLSPPHWISNQVSPSVADARVQ